MPWRQRPPSGCALQADPAWLERYDRRAGDHDVPQGEAKRRAHAEQIGRDGHQLLAAITAPGAPIWLRQIPAVELLRQAWLQNFCLIDDAPTTGPEAPLRVRWRTDQEGFPPSLLMVASPYDPEVHYARKQSTIWIGYKVHLTETCDEGGPHLITHVETTPAPVVDRDALEDIHAALEAKGLLPETHLADAGYVAADQLVASRKKGVTLLGPAPKDYQWQARSGEGFTVQDFLLDWEREVATCPAGHQSKSWGPDYHQGRTAFKVRFSHLRTGPRRSAGASQARLAVLAQAQANLEVICRFGRFPHRNPVLGRASTADELVYLAKGDFVHMRSLPASASIGHQRGRLRGPEWAASLNERQSPQLVRSAWRAISAR